MLDSFLMGFVTGEVVVGTVVVLIIRYARKTWVCVKCGKTEEEQS